MPKDTPLHKAANQGELATVEELIKSAEVSVDAPGAQDRTALQRACGGNQLECVKLLLDLGADKNKTDKAGRTPLHWASIGGHVEVVEHLLSLDVNTSLQTSSGQTALHSAIDGDKVDVVKCLIGSHESGKTLNFELKDKEGKTAFELAKDKGNKEVDKMVKFEKVDVSKEGGGCSLS